MARVDSPQLTQPHRSVTDERANEARTTSATAQTFERIKDRQIGVARSVLLDTLAERSHDQVLRSRSRDEFAYQRALAYSRLAGDQHDLPPALQGLAQEILERADLGIASNQSAGRRGFVGTR